MLTAEMHAPLSVAMSLTGGAQAAASWVLQKGCSSLHCCQWHAEWNQHHAVHLQLSKGVVLCRLLDSGNAAKILRLPDAFNGSVSSWLEACLVDACINQEKRALLRRMQRMHLTKQQQLDSAGKASLEIVKRGEVRRGRHERPALCRKSCMSLCTP